jgi:hypothetical protein
MRQAVRREGPLLPYAQFHQNPQLSKEETHLMLMVMDIGNTNIVVGVHDGKEWIAHWRLSSSRSRTSDEFGIILGSMFQAGGVDMKAVKDIIVSTVVPPLLVPLCNMCKRYFGITPFVVTSNCNTGLKLDYDHPNEIGADRIVNAVAAHHMYGDKGNLIIIDFGTATTFCALRPDGEYLGGAIAPGIGISTEALFQKAAKLPRIELIKPKMAICHDTIHAMRSGVIFGFVGQMDGIITRMKKELGGQAFVVVTGGFGKLMASESELVDVVEPFLTLEGLLILHKMNRKQ